MAWPFHFTLGSRTLQKTIPLIVVYFLNGGLNSLLTHKADFREGLERMVS